METQLNAHYDRYATGEDWFDEDEFEELSEPFVTDEDEFEQGAAFDGFKICVRSRQFRSGRVTAVLEDLRAIARLSRDESAVSCFPPASIALWVAVSATTSSQKKKRGFSP